ncbi:SpoIIE family protein phosphatase [Streptomyces sp. NPDC056121]|uniref:SpoIIE family protein phosphatase n=1 Tax=Streptomyces TaxID=1883 RepID=UPI00311B01EF
MLVRRDSSVDCSRPPACAPAQGLGAHGGEPARPHQVDFVPGDQLLLYADGVTEVRDAHRQGRPRAAATPVGGISRPPG